MYTDVPKAWGRMHEHKEGVRALASAKGATLLIFADP